MSADTASCSDTISFTDFVEEESFIVDDFPESTIGCVEWVLDEQYVGSGSNNDSYWLFEYPDYTIFRDPILENVEQSDNLTDVNNDNNKWI